MLYIKMCFTDVLTAIVNDILLHRNDSDCRNDGGCQSYSARLTSILNVNIRLWLENVIFITFLKHGGGTQFILGAKLIIKEDV